MKTKHTPGPWYYERGGCYIRSEISNLVIGSISPLHFHYDINVANAKLMAASPEMFSRLEFIVEYINTLVNPSVALQLVRAEAEESIKKATS